MRSYLLLVAVWAMVILGSEATTKKVTWTMYNLAKETDFPIGSGIKLKSCNGKTTFGDVNKKFAKSIRLEGSGLLKDGVTYLNLASCNNCEGCQGDSCSYNCFEKTDCPKGSKDNTLVPFISVASNEIPYKTLVFIEKLKGRKLPTGETHNGCVRVDDTCGTCKHPNWIDWYVFSLANLKKLQGSGDFDSTQAEYPSKCTLGKYKSEK